MVNAKRKYTLGDCALMLAAIAVGVPLRGWALSEMWRWFVVPLGAPAIGTWHAVGLGVLVAFVRNPTVKPGDDVSPIKMAATFVLTPPIVVGIAWIVQAGAF